MRQSWSISEPNNYGTNMSPSCLAARPLQEEGISSLETLTHIGRSQVWLGLEAILVGQVTGTWTAFEVMAGDLWEAAINCHPHGLADLKGKKREKGNSENKQQTGADDLRSSTNEDILSLKLSRRRPPRDQYDLKNRWGSVLKPEDGFTSLARIRTAYYKAFFESSTSIEVAIDDECFDKLSLLRNVIVHRGTIVDKKYRDEMQRFSDLSEIQVGKPICIDGPMVAKLVSKCIEKSMELIRAVDSWLASH